MVTAAYTRHAKAIIMIISPFYKYIAPLGALALLLWQLYAVMMGQGFNCMLLFRAVQPKAGSEMVLPAIAIDADVLLLRHGITHFALGQNLDDHIIQRITEYTYPLRVDKDAPVLITTTNEMPPGCTLLERTGHVALYVRHSK